MDRIQGDSMSKIIYGDIHEFEGDDLKEIFLSVEWN